MSGFTKEEQEILDSLKDDAPLSTRPKTVRTRLRREEAATPRPKMVARLGEAFDAVSRRMQGMFAALEGNFIPASRRARLCGKCGIAPWEHRKNGVAWKDGGPCKNKGAVSVAPSLLQLGRVAKVYPSAILTQDGGRWTVREPLTGFVRGRGNSRRAALRAALRGGSRRAS